MDEVAGYRVLRAAGHGARSRLLLGYDDGVSVVLKVCGADDPRVPVELAALDRAAGEHVVRLLDVAADEHGTTLVLERLPGGSLAELLDRRPALGAGEAVTILAPLAATLERLHAAGVAHGSVSLGSVHFRDDGAPALLGFGAAELFAPGAPEVVRETVAGVGADRAALREVASLVLGRIGGEDVASARRVRASLAAATPARLADALYAMAQPTAVSMEAEPVEADPATAAVEGAAAPALDDGPVGPGRPALLPPWLVALLPGEWRERVPAGIETLRAVWARWPVARRRIVLALGTGGLTVLVALALLPPTAPTNAVAPVAVAPTGTPEPLSALPEDPVDAAVLLLERREECLRELSVLCLDDVVQQGSAAQAADVALVRTVLGGGELPSSGVIPGPPVLVEQLGDSALLDLPAGSSPASLLVLRTAEGWRIRQYLGPTYLGTTYLEAPAFETGTG